MHGLRDLNGKMATPERSAQARRLLAMYRQVVRSGDLGVICGDFNVEPDSETLAILSDAGFTELVTSGEFAGTRNSRYTKLGRFADYMLVSEGTNVEQFNVVYDPEVSDHCPLILDI